MRILGIVAEYDPFHRGHERHLRLAREMVQPDFTYVVLSGCFKQRGELAMLSPYDRAECALRCGADAVFSLPAVWTVRDAEHYALGAVALLKSLGITHLAFGMETFGGDGSREAGLARRAAELLENPAESLRKSLRAALQQGAGYPRAMSFALAEEDPEAAELASRPNSLLAVCYLRAILRLGGGIQPAVIPRNGSYHGETPDPGEPSASYIRDALRRGDYGHAFEAVPPISGEIIRRAFLEQRIPREEILDQLLIRRLREMDPEEAKLLPDVSEGLERRLLEAAARARTRKQLLEETVTRRYTRARISRICAAALLGVTRKDTERAPLPAEAVLLGLKRKPEMTALWKKGGVPVTSREHGEADLQAWRIRAQCTGEADTLPWTEKIVSVN